MKLRRFTAKHLLLLFLGGAVSACTSLETFQRVNPTGNAFQKNLLKQYQTFAASEAKAYDWSTSQHFINKGMRLAYGHEALPEDPIDWSIPDSFLNELQEARKNLIQVLKDTKAIEEKPEIAAKAQFSYDCWVEQQEENWQPEDIETCRDGFFEAMHALKGATAQAIAPAPASAPTPQHALKAEEPPYTYRIFFPFNSTELSNDSEEMMQSVVKEVKTLKDYEIVLNGYTDRAGSEEYNLELSKRRAMSIKKRLLAAGVPEKSISIFAYGESDNAVPTANGIEESANRRVEIFITDE